MSDWRILGYVPDSDEEEYDLNLPANKVRRDEADQIGDRSNKAAAHNADDISQRPITHHEKPTDQSTIQQLETTLSLGLQTVRHVLATATPAASPSHGIAVTDADDSPLTSLHSSATNSPSKLSIQNGFERLSTQGQSSPQADELRARGLYAPRRALRTRAPIQEHPYMLEDAKYRQLMKDRGLRPINVPTVSRSGETAKANDESQQTEDFQASPVEESFDLGESSSPASLHSLRLDSEQEDRDAASLRTGQTAAEDDLPDLSQILRDRHRSLKKKTYRVKARRDGLIIPSGQPQQLALDADIFTIPRDSDSTSSRSLHNTQFRVPPSPPRSESHLTAEEESDDDEEDVIASHRKSRDPNTPGALPTPVLSSDRGARKRISAVVSSSESSQSESEENSNTPVQSEDDDSQGLRWIRQRLRGVLPPSFLKLNQPTPIQPQNRQRPMQPSSTASNERGVARRTNTGVSKTSALSLHQTLQFSEPELSDSEMLTSSDLQNHGIDVFHLDPTSPNDSGFKTTTIDIIEEDQVDRMLPSTRSQGWPTQPRHHRQRRIDNGWAVMNRRSAANAKSAGLISRDLHRNKLQRQKTLPVKRRRTRHKKGNEGVSVLDAPGLFGVEKKAQPRFLKLAARQGRKAAQSMWQSPTRKFFSMATDTDTEDMNQELKAWSKNRRHRRQPAEIAGANVSIQSMSNDLENSKNWDERATRLTSSANIDVLKRSTNALLARISRKDEILDTNSALSGTRATDVAVGDRTQNPTNYLRSLFAHHNRSGQGHLLSRSPGPRAAQIEASAAPTGSLKGIPIRTVLKLDRKASDFEKIMQHRPINRGPANGPRKTTSPRKPKKQTPKQTVLHRTIDSSSNPLAMRLSEKSQPAARALYTKPGANMHTNKMLGHNVTVAVDAVRSLQLPPSDTVFGAESIVGGSHLRNAIQKFYDEDYSPYTRNDGVVPISTPLSLQLIPCGQYNAQVQALISTALIEILTAMSEPGLAVDDACQHYKRCNESLDSIARYLDTSLYFEDARGVTELIETIYDRVEQFVSHSDVLDSEQNIQVRMGRLQCLNWFTILTVHLLILTRNALRDFEQNLATKLQVVWRRIAAHIFEIVFETQSLEMSLERLRSVFDKTLSIHSVITSFPEADAIVLVWNTCHLITRKDPSIQFYKQLESTVTKFERDPFSQLRQFILILCFVLPLTKMSEHGDVSQDLHKIKDDNDACFSILARCIHDVAKDMKTYNNSPTTGKLIESAEDMCLKIVQVWEWNLPPTIVTAIREAYAGNAWLPFYSVPDSNDVFQRIDFGPYITQNQSDNDFYKFLELFKICLRGLCRPVAEAVNQASNKVAGQIRGLVYALLPNSSGSFDARESLHADRFLALKNCFALYVVLTTDVPDGFQPRLEDLRYMVDFSTSHSQACKVATAAWKAIATSCVQRHESVRGTVEAINKWMESMLQQSVKYFEVCHQFDAMIRLEDLLSTITLVVRQCDSEVQARHLIMTPVFDTVRLLLNNPAVHRNNQQVIIAGLSLLQAYAETKMTGIIQDTLSIEVQLVLKSVIQQTLSSNTICDPRVLRVLISAWFTIAQNMVRTSYKHWNDFIDPHSNLSIDFLSGLRTSHVTHEVKECFYSDLIQADQAYFFLECRPIVFATWVTTLLLPTQRMRFEHVLTNAILKKESDSLMIKDLAAQIFVHRRDRDLTLQEVADSRIIILRHIIQNIYGQQNCPEEEWLAGGLDSVALRDLLRTMTKTMKANWIDLKHDPVEQSSYTTLIHAMLNEMETYPIPGFKIDPWFSGSYEFPRPVQTLDNIFKCRFGETGTDVTKDSIHNFQLQYTRELQEDRESLLVQELLRVFNCTDPLRARHVDGQAQYSIDIAKQAKFMQVVFPAYIETGIHHRESLTMFPVLNMLIQMTGRIQFRIDNLDLTNMRHHITATAAILCAVRKCIEATRARHVATKELVEYTRIAAASLFSLVEFGIEIDESVYEMCISNVLGIYTVVRERLPEFLALTSSSRENPSAANATTTITTTDNDFLLGGGGGGKEIICTHTVYDRWHDPPDPNLNLDLVPPELQWTLLSECTEPELSWEEQALRTFARDGLKRWDERFLAAVPPSEREKEWHVTEVTRSMMGLVRDLQARDLMGEFDTDDEGSMNEWDE